MRILTQEEVVRVFGDPAPHMRPDGSIKPSWEAQILTKIPLPGALPLSFAPETKVMVLRCHKLIAPLLEQALYAIHSVPNAWASIDDLGGCYQFRTIAGKKALSRHSFGIAIDLDCRENPMFALIPRVNPFVRRIFKEHGFAWGGARRWGGDFPNNRADGMHYEIAYEGVIKLGLL